MATTGSSQVYVVRHSAVDGHREGAIVTQANFPETADIQRLVDMGAIEKYSPSQDVPTEPSTGAAVLDPNRSENPPTSPAAGIVPPPDAPQEVKDVADALAAASGAVPPPKSK